MAGDCCRSGISRSLQQSPQQPLNPLILHSPCFPLVILASQPYQCFSNHPWSTAHVVHFSSDEFEDAAMAIRAGKVFSGGPFEKAGGHAAHAGPQHSVEVFGVHAAHVAASRGRLQRALPASHMHRLLHGKGHFTKPSFHRKIHILQAASRHVVTEEVQRCEELLLDRI